MPKITVLDAEKKIFLYESNIAEELTLASHIDEEVALHRMATVCGCAMFLITEETLAAAQAVNPQTMVATGIVEPGNYIVMVDEFTSTLNEVEREAVLLHELGHVEAEHLNGQDKGIVHQLEFELEADRAAVAVVGKEAMASALVKLINRSHDIQQEYLAKKGGDGFLQIMSSRALIEESRQACLNHEITLKRLEALQ